MRGAVFPLHSTPLPSPHSLEEYTYEPAHVCPESEERKDGIKRRVRERVRVRERWERWEGGREVGGRRGGR